MDLQPGSTKTRFISLRLKLLLGFTLLFSLVFAAAFYWFYTFAEQVAMSRIQEDLVNTLLAAAEGVDGDELVALAKEGIPNEAGFSDDPRFENQMDWLDSVHHLEPRAWPYLYVPGTLEREIIYIADLNARYDASKAALFQESLISKGFSTDGLTELTLRTTDGKFRDYTDKWGWWVSAYAPVNNANGETVGAMGLDFEADYVDQVRQSVLRTILYAFALTYVVLFFLVWLASGAFTGPIGKLTKVAERIGEGDYEQDLSDMWKRNLHDEISTLARVFDSMVDKVHQREQTLRHQVEELKIEIDEAKRRAQVSEIVDSDFFRDLQSKAHKVRTRPRSGPQAPPTDGEATP